MRALLIAAFLMLSLVSLAACNAPSSAAPVPSAAATETPGAVLTAPASTALPTITSTSIPTIAETPTEILVPSPTTVSTPSPVPVLPISTPSAVSSPSPRPALPIPTPSAGPATPTSLPRNGPLTVTLADAGKTVEVKVGSSFLLALGEVWDWNVTIADPSIVSRQINIAVVRGAQGVYNAHRVGRTTLRAVGDPLCRKTNPPCGLPSRLVEITIVVI